MTIQKVPTKGEFYLMDPDTRGEVPGHGGRGSKPVKQFTGF